MLSNQTWCSQRWCGGNVSSGRPT